MKLELFARIGFEELSGGELDEIEAEMEMHSFEDK